MFKKSFDVVTIGGAVRDISFWSKAGRIFNTPQNLTAQRFLAFEYGAKIGVDDAFCSLGGGASNSAVTFSRLGLKVAALVRVGQERDGKIIVENFDKQKVNTSLVQYDNNKSSGFSFIISTEKKEKDHIAFLFRGANENLKFPGGKFKYIRTGWFYITSLSGENWKRTLNEAYQWGKERKIKIAWNPGNKQLQAGKKSIEKLLKQTEVLILNKDEAIELVLSGLRFGRKTPTHLNKPLYLLNILKDWGPKIVVITEGRKGAYAYEGKKIIKILPLRKKVIDTTGVGDAFGSAFVAALIYQPGNIKEALKWGIVNSNSVITKLGAQGGIVTKSEMQRLTQKTNFKFR